MSFGRRPVRAVCCLAIAIASFAEPSAGAQDAPDAPDTPAQAPQADDPHARDPHAANPHAPPARKPIAEERLDMSLSPGTIRVRVLDRVDVPVAGAEVELGIMRASGEREQKPGRTGEDGSFTFEGLETGDQRAYRVNVPFEGARYSSSPFRLPAEGGFDVVVRRLPVTRDERMVVLYVGATSLELKEDRIKIVQQSRLLNLGADTYVFPEGGALVRLPSDYVGVQTQESMGDQRVRDDGSQGVRIEGSLPPGETTLLWGFDLPIEGARASFEIGLPWITFAYRVIADAPPGLALSVDEMPEPFVQRDAGRSFLITEMQRRVGEAPFRTLRVTLTGIPGPGPSRFIALGLALGIALAGMWIARRKPQAQATAREPVAALAPNGTSDITSTQVQALHARIAALNAELAQGAIGPEFHREQLDALVEELAEALYVRQGAAPVSPSAG